MTFKKKVKYENMYNWAGADQGSCFYCKEDKDLAFSFFAGVQRGICPDCLAEFAIGNVGADRHVIEHLLKVAELKSREAVIAWFQEHGVTLSDPDMDEESGTISYIAVDEGESEAEILIGEDGKVEISY